MRVTVQIDDQGPDDTAPEVQLTPTGADRLDMCSRRGEAIKNALQLEGVLMWAILGSNQ